MGARIIQALPQGTRLKYPLTSSGGYDYKGQITFAIAKVNPGDLEEQMASISANVAARATSDGDKEQATASGAEQRALYGSEQRTIKTNKTVADTNKGQVSLYLPAGIQFTDGAEYQSVDLGIIGSAAEKAINTGSSLAGAVADAATQEVGSLISSILSGNGTAAKVAGTKLASRMGSESVSGGVQSALKVTVNPNSRSLFRSVATRKFTFAFKMISGSQAEADEIKKIVKWFRSNMYPEDDSKGSLSYAYKFPAPFLIRMAYDNKQVATKLLPCYLENISVGYNSTTMGMHASGDFIETDLQISFVETRALRKDEIIKENY